MPTDTNAGGDIFGGWIMSQVDIAGSIAAIRHVGKRVVTVAVNALHFKKPVYVGDLLSCYAHVEKTGRTSIVVAVEVYVERYREGVEVVKVTEATLTYVAVNKKGRPEVVPSSA
ncbi:Acyl-CoA hydrolase [hydrothermal vent metagenome]|uniref:Acyl-CoA hydrolase n=1 Tax=hydrothermal vent metagenome TaxID=652676 RepID=A0A3B1ACU6_9ZZZZ